MSSILSGVPRRVLGRRMKDRSGGFDDSRIGKDQMGLRRTGTFTDSDWDDRTKLGFCVTKLRVGVSSLSIAALSSTKLQVYIVVHTKT
jgi:hypothetical protein